MDVFINSTDEPFNLLPTVTQVPEIEMLKASNFESCRLCLGEIRDSNITLLDGIIKDMLEIILPELNFSICETPAICKTCLETLKQSYNFKSSCLEVEDKVQDFVNPQSRNTIDLKQVLKKENKISHISENHVVCRTCLGLGEENTCTKLCSYDGDPLKNMVEKCLPEVGIDLTNDPIICSACLEQLEEQFHFIMQCLDTEEKINYYCEKKNTFKQIDLHGVYLFSMIDEHEDVEKQYGLIENCNFEKVSTAVTVEDNSNKNDAISKQMQGNVKNVSNSVPLVDLTRDTLSNNIKKGKIEKDHFNERESNPCIENMTVQFFEHRPIKEIKPPPPTEQVTFQISKDGNGEDIITSETSCINEDDGSDVSVTSVDELLTKKFEEYIPSKKRKKHEIIKTSGAKKEKIEYKNEDSDEASDNSSSQKKRLVTRKCKLCNFKTKYTSRMKAHRTVNHSSKLAESSQDCEPPKKTRKSKAEPEPIPQLRCRFCPYRVTDPEEYRKHREEHRKEREQKCDVCGAKFVQSESFRKHVESHSSPAACTPTTKVVPKKTHSVRHTVSKPRTYSLNFSGQFLKMFKCQICPYQTRMRSNLVKHSLTHKRTTEIIKHKCKFCNFETIHKDNFLSHMNSHSQDSENLVKKCFLCSFQPKTEEALRQHVNLVHKSGTG